MSSVKIVQQWNLPEGTEQNKLHQGLKAEYPWHKGMLPTKLH